MRTVVANSQRVPLAQLAWVRTSAVSAMGVGVTLGPVQRSGSHQRELQGELSAVWERSFAGDVCEYD